jgi:hypothetical protein
MNLFWSVFLAVALATQLPLILGILWMARKIIVGLVIAWAVWFAVGTYCYEAGVRAKQAKEQQETLAANHPVDERVDDPVGDFAVESKFFLEQMQKPWPGGKPPLPSLDEPPPPVSKPIPAPTPVPAKPETLYTSN